MDSVSRAVWTIDEYSFVVSGRKVTIPKGEHFYELSRPNSRWVLVSRVSDSFNLFLPLKILTEDSFHSNNSRKFPMAQPGTGNMSQTAEASNAETDANKIPETKAILSPPDSKLNFSLIQNEPGQPENAKPSTCAPDTATTGYSCVIQTEAAECKPLPNPKTAPGQQSSSPNLGDAGGDNAECRADLIQPNPTTRNDVDLLTNKLIPVQSSAPPAEPITPASDREITIDYCTQNDAHKPMDSVTLASPKHGVAPAQSDVPPAPVSSTSNTSNTTQASSPTGLGVRTANPPIHYCPHLADHIRPLKEHLPPVSTAAPGVGESLTKDVDGKSHTTTFKSTADSDTANTSTLPASDSVQLRDQESTINIRSNRPESSALRQPESTTWFRHTMGSDSVCTDQVSQSMASTLNPRCSAFYVQPETACNTSASMPKVDLADSGDAKLLNVERRGTVQWKKLKKNFRSSERWTDAFAVLSGHYLLIYKDIKSSMPKAAQPLGKYSFRFHIRDLQLTDASESETSKKNVLKVAVEDTPGKTTLLLLAFPPTVFESWKIAIGFAQNLVTEGRLAASPARRPPRSASKLDQGILAKLREFFQRRPTAEDLRGRGILKNEPVFASSIVQICQNESSDVPRFVVRVIEAIEARGLEQRGIYRVAGNAALVQKLRCCVDQGNYSLDADTWSLEVLTDSLKLFFRELKEPLFICELFPKIKELLELELPSSETVQRVIDLINTMPAPHIATARALFHHLNKVMKLSDTNQMTPENLATVFGPGLLRDDQSANQWATLVVQVPFVNLCLRHLNDIFPMPADQHTCV